MYMYVLALIPVGNPNAVSSPTDICQVSKQCAIQYYCTMSEMPHIVYTHAHDVHVYVNAECNSKALLYQLSHWAAQMVGPR